MDLRYKPSKHHVLDTSVCFLNSPFSRFTDILLYQYPISLKSIAVSSFYLTKEKQKSLWSRLPYSLHNSWLIHLMTMSGDASVSLEMSCSSSFSSVDGNRQLQTSQTSQYYGSEDIAEDGSKNLTSDHNIATQIPLNEEIFTPSSLAAKTKRPLQEQAKDNTDLCLLDNNDTPKKRLRSSTRLIVEKHRREETKQQKEKEKEERKLQRELEKNQRLQERELKKKVLEEEKRLREEKREQEILKRKAEKEAKEREREEKKRILEMEREEKRKAQEKEREEKKKSIEAEKLKKEEEKRKKENVCIDIESHCFSNH